MLHFTAAFGCALRQQSTPASSDPVKMQEEKRMICFRSGQNLELCLTSKKKNQDRYLDRLDFYSSIRIHIHLYSASLQPEGEEHRSKTKKFDAQFKADVETPGDVSFRSSPT